MRISGILGAIIVSLGLSFASSSFAKETGKGSEQASTVTGKVLSSSKNQVWMEHMGLAVQVRIESSTTFLGEGIKRATDLKPGQEVRASITLRGQENVASKIEAVGLPQQQMKEEREPAGK